MNRPSFKPKVKTLVYLLLVFMATLFFMSMKTVYDAYASQNLSEYVVKGSSINKHEPHELKEIFTTALGTLRPVDFTDYADGSKYKMTLGKTTKYLKKQKYYIFVSYDKRLRINSNYYRTVAFDLSWVKQKDFEDKGREQFGSVYGLRVRGAQRGNKSSWYKRHSDGSRYTIRVRIDKGWYDKKGKGIDAITWATYKFRSGAQSYISTWAIPESVIEGKIKAYNEKWYEEYLNYKETDKNYWFGCDGVIQHRNHGSVLSTYTWKSWEKGSSAWRSSMYDRYARCFSTKGRLTPPKETTPETYYIVKSDHEKDMRNNEIANRLYKVQNKTETSKSAPKLKTYNYSNYSAYKDYSDEDAKAGKTGYKYYDISKAIPTTESFTTGERNSTWYGEVGITRVHGSIYQTKPIDYVYTTCFYDWGIIYDYDSEGNCIGYHYGYRKSVQCKPIGEIDRQYYSWTYFFISALNLRELQGTQTQNGAYEVVYYSDDENGKLKAKQGDSDASNPQDFTKQGAEMSDDNGSPEIPYFIAVIKQGGGMVYYCDHSKISESQYKSFIKQAASGSEISAAANNRQPADSTNEILHRRHVYVDDGDIYDSTTYKPDDYGTALALANKLRDDDMTARVNGNYSTVAHSTRNDIVTLNNQNYLDETNCYIAFQDSDKNGWWYENNGFLVSVPSGNGGDSDPYARFAKPLYEKEDAPTGSAKDKQENEDIKELNSGESNSKRGVDNDTKSLGDYYIRSNEDSKAGIGVSGSASTSDIQRFRSMCIAEGGRIVQYVFGASTPVGGDIVGGAGDFANAKKDGYYQSTIKPYLERCKAKYPKGDNIYTFNKVGHAPDFVQSECDVTIPEKTKNGRYYSGLTSTYRLFTRERLKSDKEKEDINISALRDGWTSMDSDNSPIHRNIVDTDKGVNRTAIYDQDIWRIVNGQKDKHIDPKWSEDDDYENGKGTIVGWKNYLDNEPVVVHSPVIAPFHIEGSKHTQIVKDKDRRTKENGYDKDYGDNKEWKSSDGSIQQLVLDRTYRIKWDWKNYFEKKEKYNVGYNAPAGFSKYISRKEIRFPFAVEVNGVFYDVLYDEDGLLASKSGKKAVYTRWITVWDKSGFETRIKEGSGSEISNYEYETDSDGNIMYDDNGDPVYKLDSSGNKIAVVDTNEDGTAKINKIKTYSFRVPNERENDKKVTKVENGPKGINADSFIIDYDSNVEDGKTYVYTQDVDEDGNPTNDKNDGFWAEKGDTEEKEVDGITLLSGNLTVGTEITIGTYKDDSYNGVDYVDIYIPSWANEGLYGTDTSYGYKERTASDGSTDDEKAELTTLKTSGQAYNASVYQIEGRVIANNYNDETEITVDEDLNDALNAIEEYKNATTPGGTKLDINVVETVIKASKTLKEAEEAYEKNKTSANKAALEKAKTDYDIALENGEVLKQMEKYGYIKATKKEGEKQSELEEYLEKVSQYRNANKELKSIKDDSRRKKLMKAVKDLDKEFEKFYLKRVQRSGTMDPQYNHRSGFTDAEGGKRTATVTNLDLLEMTDEDMSKYRDMQYYCARYSIPVQVSGTIYGLQVDAINDERDFDSNYNDSGRRTDGIYSFASNKEEKKNGTKNRLKFYSNDNFYPDYKRDVKKNSDFETTDSDDNTKTKKQKAASSLKKMVNYLRYTLDGMTTDKWDTKNTLAMEPGKSNSTAGAGALHPGHKIAIELKTIASLWGSEDYVELIPHYRYVGTDGTVFSIKGKTPENSIDIWYKDEKGRLVKMGSDYDIKNMTTAHLGESYFNDARYDYLKNYTKGLLTGKTPLTNTASIDGKSENEILNTDVKVSCLSHIIIPSKLRLFTADEGQLIENLSLDAGKSKVDTANDLQTVSRYTVDSKLDEDHILYGIDALHNTDGSTKDKVTDKSVLARLPESMYARYKKSMQTWYATYQIPTNIYVCEKGALEKYVEDNGSGADINDFTGWKKQGKLILSFEIYTHQTVDGKDHRHLEYTTRMEAAENPDRPGTPTPPGTTPPETDTPPDDPDAPYDDPENPDPTNPTDVGEIDLTTTIEDRYDSTPLYIE